MNQQQEAYLCWVGSLHHNNYLYETVTLAVVSILLCYGNQNWAVCEEPVVPGVMGTKLIVKSANWVLSFCDTYHHSTVLLLCTTGLQFGESDSFIKEGPTSRSIAVQRHDVSDALNIRVLSSTIGEYKENHVQMGCSLTLDDLDVQESLVDPAESKYYMLWYLKTNLSY